MWLRVVAWYFKIGGFVVALFAVVALSPGTYTFRGGYGDHLAEITSVVVSQ